MATGKRKNKGNQTAQGRRKRTREDSALSEDSVDRRARVEEVEDVEEGGSELGGNREVAEDSDGDVEEIPKPNETPAEELSEYIGILYRGVTYHSDRAVDERVESADIRTLSP